MDRYETIIIGAGASGLMTAALMERKSDILIIDTNRDIGAKIAVSGGGRCNLTNATVEADNYLGDPYFIADILRGFDQHRALEWFAQRGVVPTEEKSGQYFCKKSTEVITALRQAVRGVTLLHDTRVTGATKLISTMEGDSFRVETDRDTYQCKNMIIASGGLSYPKLGASDIGHTIAASFGHRIVTPAPALVGFTLQLDQFFFKSLSGVAVDVVVHIEGKDIMKKVIREKLLFAHKGISGPAILNASLYWKKGEITIDFLPDFSWQMLPKSKKLLSTLLPLPKRVAKAFLDHLGIHDMPANQLTGSDSKRLQLLGKYSFAPAGTFGYSKAEVSRGGICTDEVDSKSMMSRREPNLYCVGEVLDVTGELGGYNFQWAFASANCCAESINGKG